MCSSGSADVKGLSCSINADDPQSPVKENPGFGRRVIEPDLCLKKPRATFSVPVPRVSARLNAANLIALQLAPSGRSSSFYPASRRWLTIPAPLVRYLWTLLP